MPLAIPGQRWEAVSMDFIVKLSKTARGFNAITVFLDKLPKQVHFYPSYTTESGADVARLFSRKVFRLHGMPRAIVSDRDSRFTGRFWTIHMNLMDTKTRYVHCFSSPIRRTDRKSQPYSRGDVTRLHLLHPKG